MNAVEKARERFADDLFATEATGIIIEDVKRDYSKCSLELKQIHKNANNQVMGGAIFTLADFAFAVASNEENPVTVSLSSNIVFLSPVKGKTLFAEAKAVKSGKRTCTFNISVYDDTETAVATVTTVGMRMVQ